MENKGSSKLTINRSSRMIKIVFLEMTTSQFPFISGEGLINQVQPSFLSKNGFSSSLEKLQPISINS